MAIVVAGAAGGAMRWRAHARTTAATTAKSWPPLPHPVTVEVLNAGKVSGAARAGMRLLRQARLDVVYYGNAPATFMPRDRNQVLVRLGDTTGAGRVVDALGDAEIVNAPDSTRLVDLTVLLGDHFSVPPRHP